MLEFVNTTSNMVIFVGTLWAVLTQKVVTRSGAATVLGLINFGVLVDLIGHGQVSQADALVKFGVACGVGYMFWRVEVRHWIRIRV